MEEEDKVVAPSTYPDKDEDPFLVRLVIVFAKSIVSRCLLNITHPWEQGVAFKIECI